MEENAAGRLHETEAEWEGGECPGATPRSLPSQTDLPLGSVHVQWPPRPLHSRRYNSVEYVHPH